MSSQEKRRALALLVGAASIWGGSYVVTDLLLGTLGPFAIMLARFGIGFVVLLPAALRAGYRPRMSVQGRFVAFAVTGLVLHLGLEIVGLRYTTPSNAALIVASNPAITAALAWMLTRETITRRHAAGIALSVVGVVAVTAPGASAGIRWVGDVLVLLGVVMWGLYTLQGRKLGVDVHPLVSTTAALGSAILITLPATAWEVTARVPAGIDGGVIAGVLYLGAGASAAAFVAWNAALTRVDAATAAPFVNLVPVVGLALGIALGDRPAAIQLAGGALVGAGVSLAWSRPRPARHRAISDSPATVPQST